MKSCPKCSQNYADDAEFCSGDGSRLTAGASAPHDQLTAPLTHPSVSALNVGQVLANRYKILRFVGKGGMGEVYEAEDQELRERIALKTILAEAAKQEESIQRFKREIQLARKVTHPNVSRIFDLVYHEKIIFLTMELLEGETLAHRLQRAGAMSTREAFPLVAQMAKALGAAHRAGIIHRDFKCSNVILVPSQGEEAGVRAVVTDFGLARRTVRGEGSTFVSTASGEISGTPAYMAPEQVEGREITPAADIYALGVVMYEMVTGRCPFEGDTPVSVAVKRLVEPPPSPRSFNNALDMRWERVILRCLARNPEDRFELAEEVVEALHVAAPPVAPSEQPRMLEAAAPKRAAVGRSMQLLAMIRLVESAGLKAHLDAEETPSLTPEDVRAKPFQLEFPLDRKGTPQPAEIVLKLDSPDFEPKSQAKKLMVPVERDSDVCTFLLTPRVAGELLVNLEVLKGEVLVASRAMRTVAEVSAPGFTIGSNVLVSIPLEVIAYGLRATAGPPEAGVPAFAGPVPEMPSAAGVTPPPPPPAWAPPAPPPRPARSEGPRDSAMVATPGSAAGDFLEPLEEPSEVPRPWVRPSVPPAYSAIPQPAAKSWTARNAKVLGLASLALVVGVLIPLGYMRQGRQASPIPPTMETASPAPAPGPAPSPSPSPKVELPSPPLDQSPVSVRGKAAEGDYHLRRGEFDQAIDLYQQALKLDPSNPGIIQKLAQAIKACKTENAVMDSHDKCGADLIKKRISDGDYHLRRGEFDQAIASYQEGWKLDPSNALLRKKLDGAIQACKQENAVEALHLKCGAP